LALSPADARARSIVCEMELMLTYFLEMLHCTIMHRKAENPTA
jgi:hypothetical protein